MKQSLLVSIVTPSYNQAQFLEKTILSVLNQDYPNLEYIIIDGGSTDVSVDIIRKYEDRLAYWVSEHDEGQADAINKGWRRSTGEILAYLNSDDTYEPGAVSAAVEAFSEHPEVYLVYGHLNHIDDQGRVLRQFYAPPYDLRTFIGGNITCYIRQPTAFIRRAALEKVGMLYTSLHYSMDHDLFVRICRHFPAYRIPRIMANFRYHPSSKTMSDEQEKSKNSFWPEQKALLERVARDPEFPMDVRALAWRRIGICSYEYRDMRIARKMWIRAIPTHRSLLADRELIYLFAKSLLGSHVVEMASQARMKLLGWLK
ncbi:MAG: glycosyltransferase [Dehalococcoidia bacterium]|nr:glycosyltransferase [Dehalococcoidia bacterium]